MQYTVTVWVYVKCSVKVNNEVCMYENVATAVLFTGGNGHNCMHLMMLKIQQTLYLCRNTDIGSQCA